MASFFEGGEGCGKWTGWKRGPVSSSRSIKFRQRQMWVGRLSLAYPGKLRRASVSQRWVSPDPLPDAISELYDGASGNVMLTGALGSTARS